MPPIIGKILQRPYLKVPGPVKISHLKLYILHSNPSPWVDFRIHADPLNPPPLTPTNIEILTRDEIVLSDDFSVIDICIQKWNHVTPLELFYRFHVSD